ncbi:MAG: hypothetical protein JRI68_25590 [Deltaproteobacteria bacterium]|nr:hypothetical protein [Deltaproteobacteria bacterium]
MAGDLERVFRALEAAKVRYLVVGGVVGRDDLIAMKRAVGRPKDLDDAAVLASLSEGDE